MIYDELERLSKQELIDLIKLQAAQLAEFKDAFSKLKADYEALKMKYDSNQKPPTSSKNSSTTPLKRSEDQPAKRKIKAPTWSSKRA